MSNPNLADTSVKAGIASGVARRAKRDKARQLAEDALEGAIAKAMQRYVEGLDAGRYEQAEDEDGEPIIVTDHDTRIKAADRVADRYLGKPAQAVELSGPDGGPITVEHEVDAAGVVTGLAALGLVTQGPGEGDETEADPPVHAP